MSKTVPVREFRQDLASLLDQVADRREHVVVTRHGRPAAVLIPVDEYDSLEETAEILFDPDTVRAAEQGLGEIERDEVVSLTDLRARLAERRGAG